MQNKNNNQKGTMTKIRMNTELRNKLFNKMKHTFENEATEEREAYLQSREYVDCLLYTSPSPRDGLLSRMPSSA